MKKNLYHVEISTLKNHTVPQLLKDFGKWLATKAYGSIGYFELIAEQIPKEITDDTKLRKDAFSFIHLPEGSLVVLSKDGSVKSIGSEDGMTTEIAKTLEEFLHLLAEGNTQIVEIDDDKAKERKVLKKWLEEKDLAPKAKAKEPAIATKKLSYNDFEKALGKTLPSSEMKELLQKLGNPDPRYNSDGYWTLEDDGICMIFEHLDDKPVNKKNEKEIIFTCAKLYTKSPQNGIKSPYVGQLPGEIQFGITSAEVHKKLGKPKVSNEMSRLDIWEQNKIKLAIKYESKTKTVEVVSIQLAKADD